MRAVGPVAAIDCGTNSTRLFIVDAQGRPLERLMRITRLGEGVDATGKLSGDAIDRCLSVLSEYREVMRRIEGGPEPVGGHVGGAGCVERR